MILQNSHWFCECPLGRDLSWWRGKTKRGESRCLPEVEGERWVAVKLRSGGERTCGWHGGSQGDYEDNNSASEPLFTWVWDWVDAQAQMGLSECPIFSSGPVSGRTDPKINADHYLLLTCWDPHALKRSNQLKHVDINTRTVVSGTLRASYDPPQKENQWKLLHKWRGADKWKRGQDRSWVIFSEKGSRISAHFRLYDIYCCLCKQQILNRLMRIFTGGCVWHFNEIDGSTAAVWGFDWMP